MLQRTLAKAALLFVVMACFGQAAQARELLQGRGWPGDGTMVAECEAGEVLAGVSGREGAWVDSLRIHCAPLRADGTIGPAVPRGIVHGGTGGGPYEVVCPVGSTMGNVFAEYNLDERVVYNVGINCGSGGLAQIGSGVPFDDDIHQTNFNCGAGDRPTGLIISSGKHINNIGVVCDRVQIAAAPPPPPTAAPATAPARPKRVISSGGGSKMSNIAFRGTWDIVTNLNGHFRMTLAQAGAAAPGERQRFTGTLVNTDGASEYDGTIEGTSPAGSMTLNFTYRQPGIEGRGTGSFTLAPDGKSISGEGIHNNSDEVTWNGTRGTADAETSAAASTSIPLTDTFEGTWATVAADGSRHDMTLNVESRSGDRVVLSGKFISTDGRPRLGGMISGTASIENRRFDYTFHQPANNGAQGGGYFELSPDGRTISGEGKSPGGTYTWTGKRK